MNLLHEALLDVSGETLSGPDGLRVHVSRSGAQRGKYNVMMYCRNPERLQRLSDALAEERNGEGFIPPVRCADSMFVTMGRVR